MVFDKERQKKTKMMVIIAMGALFDLSGTCLADNNNPKAHRNNQDNAQSELG